MNIKKVLIEYIGLIAITLVYFLMSSTDMKQFLLIAIIELPITFLYVQFNRIYKERHKTKTSS